MNGEVLTQRRQSAEIGVVTQARLGDVCELNMGQSPESASYNTVTEGLPFYQGNADFGPIYPTPRVWCNSPVKIAEAGDLLVSVRAPIGALNFANERCCIGRGLAALRVKPDSDSKFIYYALKSNVTELNARGTGSTFKAISKKALSSLLFPLPPLADQRRIATKLDRLCDIVTKRKQQLVQLQQLVKSRFVEMFGDLNGSLFPRATIGEVCEVKSGGTPDRKVREYWENGDIPWVKTTELKNCELYDSEEHITTLAMNESSAKLVPPETILLAMYGQGRTRGLTAKLKIAATTNQACACILPGDKVDQDYLWHYLVLSYEKIRALAQGAGQPNLNGKMIRSFGVPLPPLPLQREFAAFVAKVDKLAFAVRKSLESAEKLYRQQLSEAFA